MKRIGELPEAKKLVKKFAPLTASQRKLVAAAAAIHDAPDQVERAYMARHLVQCTLPHSNPGDNLPVFIRKSGNLLVGLQPGVDLQTGRSFGYPYGSLPRLLLFWITTEAVKTQSRRLKLGRSLSDFMRELDLIPASAGGGKRSDAKRLREQMARLFRCRISFDVMGVRPADDIEGRRWLSMEVAPEGEFWWSHKQPDQAALFGSWLELGEKFYEAITSGPVPTDMRALRELKRSPLALDLYTWAAHRVYSVNRNGQADFIPWDGLMKQMGADYTNVDEFARKAKAALQKVETVWRRPGLDIKYLRGTGGFMLGPSPLPISERKQIAAQS
jgi:hypothetical protein